MPTYEINIRGKVDPKLKADLKDAAAASKKLGDSTAEAERKLTGKDKQARKLLAAAEAAKRATEQFKRLRGEANKLNAEFARRKEINRYTDSLVAMGAAAKRTTAQLKNLARQMKAVSSAPKPTWTPPTPRGPRPAGTAAASRAARPSSRARQEIIDRVVGDLGSVYRRDVEARRRRRGMRVVVDNTGARLSDVPFGRPTHKTKHLDSDYTFSKGKRYDAHTWNLQYEDAKAMAGIKSVDHFKPKTSRQWRDLQVVKKLRQRKNILAAIAASSYQRDYRRAEENAKIRAGVEALSATGAYEKGISPWQGISRMRRAGATEQAARSQRAAGLEHKKSAPEQEKLIREAEIYDRRLQEAQKGRPSYLRLITDNTFGDRKPAPSSGKRGDLSLAPPLDPEVRKKFKEELRKENKRIATGTRKSTLKDIISFYQSLQEEIRRPTVEGAKKAGYLKLAVDNVKDGIKPVPSSGRREGFPPLEIAGRKHMTAKQHAAARQERIRAEHERWINNKIERNQREAQQWERSRRQKHDYLQLVSDNTLRPTKRPQATKIIAERARLDKVVGDLGADYRRRLPVKDTRIKETAAVKKSIETQKRSNETSKKATEIYSKKNVALKKQAEAHKLDAAANAEATKKQKDALDIANKKINIARNSIKLEKEQIQLDKQKAATSPEAKKLAAAKQNYQMATMAIKQEKQEIELANKKAAAKEKERKRHKAVSDQRRKDAEAFDREQKKHQKSFLKRMTDRIAAVKRLATAERTAAAQRKRESKERIKRYGTQEKAAAMAAATREQGGPTLLPGMSAGSTFGPGGLQQTADTVTGLSGWLRKGVTAVTAFTGSLVSMLYTARRTFFFFARLTEGIYQFQNQIRLSTNTNSQYIKVQKSLIAAHNESGATLIDLSRIYQRFRIATDHLGYSSDKVLQHVTTLSRVTKAFGLQMLEARGGMIQMSQGIAAGQLRGHELLSVMEQLPPIARKIAEEMGVFPADLRKLGEQGKVTAEIVLKALENMREEAADMIKLYRFGLASAFETAKTQLGLVITGFLDASGAGNELKGTIFWVRDEMTKLYDFFQTDKGVKSAVKVWNWLKDAIKGVLGALSSIAALIATGTIAKMFKGVAGATGWVTKVAKLGKLASLGTFGLGLGAVGTIGYLAYKWGSGKADAVIKDVEKHSAESTSLQTTSDEARKASVATYGRAQERLDKLLAKDQSRPTAKLAALRKVMQELQQFHEDLTKKGLPTGTTPAEHKARMTTAKVEEFALEQLAAESRERQSKLISRSIASRKALQEGRILDPKAVRSVIRKRYGEFIRAQELDVLSPMGEQEFKHWEQKELAARKQSRVNTKARKDEEEQFRRNMETVRQYAGATSNLTDAELKLRDAALGAAQSFIDKQRLQTGNVRLYKQEAAAIKEVIDQSEREKIVTDRRRRLSALDDPRLTHEERISLARGLQSDTRGEIAGDIIAGRTPDRATVDANRRATLRVKALERVNELEKIAKHQREQRLRDAELEKRQTQELTNLIGTGLTNAFLSAANAAKLFGDKFSDTFNTVFQEITKVLLKVIELNQAQSAHAEAQAADAAQGTLATAQQASAAAAKKTAAQGNFKLAAIAAAINIGTSLLGDLFSKGDSERNRFNRELADAQRRAAEQAYQQRQEIIALERRQTWSLERMNRELEQERRDKERAEQLAQSALLQRYTIERQLGERDPLVAPTDPSAFRSPQQAGPTFNFTFPDGIPDDDPEFLRKLDKYLGEARRMIGVS